MLQPPSPASREFGSPPPRSSARKRQRRLLLRASAVVLVVLGLVGAYAWRQAARPADTDPQRRMATRVLKLGKALERHAAREDRPMQGEPAYPTDEAFLAFVRALPEGAELLANPYGGPGQANVVVVDAGGGLPTAAERRAGAAIPLPDTVLGPGVAPGEPYTARTFGALVYDHDPQTDSFVLYGIGRQDDQAVLAAGTDSAL